MGMTRLDAFNESIKPFWEDNRDRLFRASYLAMLTAIRARRSRVSRLPPSSAPQRYVRSGGISGSARLALETTLMTHWSCAPLECWLRKM